MSRHPKSRRKPVLGPVAPLEDRTTPAAAFALSNNSLIAFDTDNPAAALAAVPVTGLGAGENLVGIDVRPQTGTLYGLTSDGAGAVRLYAISPRTGLATPLTAAVVQFDDGTNPVPITGTSFGFDFNPFVDRIRVVTDTGFDFRMNPNTGALVDGNNGGAATPGVNPDGPINGPVTGVDAAAYTNNAPNVAATTLYTLSAAADALYIQNPPNSGTQTGALPITLGGTALDFAAANGFDIPAGVNVAAANAAATGRAFAALTVGTTTKLYGIELSTGVATDLGLIGAGTAPVQGFTVLNDQGGLPAVGLDATGANLVRFNTGTPGTASGAIAITGGNLGTTETLVGIDYRPATGQLFGLGVDPVADTATLYIIDPQGGAATVVGTAGSIAYVDAGGTAIDLPLATAGYGFDFNPTVDRIRVVTGTGLNFRINPNTGAAVDGDTVNAGTQPDGNQTGLPGGSTGVSATAYSNAFGQPLPGPATTQYTLDAGSNTLFIQNPPNNGTQSAGVGVTLGGAALDFTEVNGFDIPAGVRVSTSNASAAGRGYALLTVGGTTGLYSINLTTGEAVLLGAPPATLAQATGLALGDAPVGTVTVAATTSVAEDGGPVTVTLTRTGGTIGAFTVTLDATGGTATGADFTGLPATVTFADGQTTATVTLTVTNDTADEPDETIILGLSNPTNGAVLGTPSTVTVTITDNDNPPADSVVVSGLTNGTAQVFAADTTGQLVATGGALNPFGGPSVNVRTATGDVNGDGVDDFILVTGPGTAARFAVLSGVDGTTVLVAPTDPFGSNFTGGGFVAAGDFNGNGRAEIVITPDQGGGPNVVIFELTSGGTLDTPRAFFALGNPTFRGGARVAAGDITGDGVPDLAVGAGFLGGPNVELHDGTDLAANDFVSTIGGGFFAFDGPDAVTLRNGVFLAIGDLDNDGFGDLIAGGGPGGGPRVLALGGQFLATGNVTAAYASPVVNIFVGSDTSRGGIRVGSADVDGDGRDDLLAASGEAQPAQVTVFLGANITDTTPTADQTLSVFGGGALPGGVFVG